MAKYFLSIGAVFKNESMGIVEWLEHYIRWGVEHFYLINDGSTDKFYEKIIPYMDRITLFENDIPKVINGNVNHGRQSQIYEKYFVSLKHESEWILIVDLDEFVYNPDGITIPEILKRYSNFSQILIDWQYFGSNGYISQPDSIIDSFIRKSTFIESYKSITKLQDVIQFKLHKCNVSGPEIRLNLDDTQTADLICNHYRVQSREHWEKSVMKRGDADCYMPESWRDWSIFDRYDLNDCVDTRLKDLSNKMKNKI